MNSFTALSPPSPESKTPMALFDDIEKPLLHYCFAYLCNALCKIIKLIGSEGLSPVAQGVHGIVMNFDHNTVSTGSRALDDRIRDLGKVIASEAINNAGQSGGGSSGGGGGSSGGGGGGSSKPKDTRVYFAVILNYNEELRTAELDRKGLNYEEKIGELEVGE